MYYLLHGNWEPKLSLIANKYPKIKEPILPGFKKCGFLLAGVYCSTELIVFSLFSLQVLKGSLNPIY